MTSEAHFHTLQERPARHRQHDQPAVSNPGPRRLHVDGHPEQRGRPSPAPQLRDLIRGSSEVLGTPKAAPVVVGVWVEGSSLELPPVSRKAYPCGFLTAWTV